MLRIGQGYDVHRYAQNRDLILGGVKIPFELGLDGHSDADVLTHAIMDAIVGALALGAMLGTIAVMTRQEIAFAIMGGLFVAEALSVMLQVGSYKLRKKRVFRMAPLHHHFEEIGWKETQVVARFWIIAIILVILGLMTLKLR